MEDLLVLIETLPTLLSYLYVILSMTVSILSSKFITSSPNFALCPPADKPEYAFIGRSNVGKSSLINAICEKKQLAKTSVKPGKTQLINYFEIESKDEEGRNKIWYLVDLPGYGYAKAAKDTRQEWKGMIDEYFHKRTTITQIFVLIDSRHSPQKLDIAFINRLHEYNKPFSLVFTKTDLVSQKEAAANIKLFLAELSKTLEKLPDYFTTSALKRSSTQAIIQAIHAL
ncbi:MAG: ribosome biogenesis GTP-binding protein YihA/YsxC [bacterium]